MESRRNKENGAVILAMLTCFFGGYLFGCLLLNLYWKYTERAAAAVFYISVYDKTVPKGFAKTIFWQILRRDFRVLSVVFVIGFLPGAGILIGMLLGTAGVLLGVLTSGILLTEGIYWLAAGASLDVALLYLQRICSFDRDAVCLAGKVSFASR